MDYEEYKRKALEPIVNYIESVIDSYSKEELEARIKKALPEKESEDERVRKAIVSLVHENSYSYKSFAGVELCDMLSYLEKQKEQKPESCDCSRDEESYTNGIHHVLMNPEAYGLIKQKPAEQLGGTFTSYDMAKTFTEGQNYVIAHPEKFGLCKPAEWSEEDEAAFGDLMWCIKQASKSAKGENDMGNIWFAENWVKNRLKSLRPQPHWKPSEKQMAALKNARYMMGQSGDYYDTTAIIDSLITDLQKLL